MLLYLIVPLPLGTQVARAIAWIPRLTVQSYLSLGKAWTGSDLASSQAVVSVVRVRGGAAARDRARSFVWSSRPATVARSPPRDLNHPASSNARIAHLVAVSFVAIPHTAAS